MPDDIVCQRVQALPPMREIIKHYGLNAEKKLGQNFLFDLNLTGRIARTAGDLSQVTVIEIGPGPGALTRSLLMAGAKRVIGIDMDKRCIEALNDYLVPVSDGRLELIEGDALAVNEDNVTKDRIKIVANLPYNVATPLLFKWLDNIKRFESLTLMFQKEVAERICAVPNTKDYGRLAVMAQWLCEVHKAFDISPQAFFPPPKVTSSVVSFIPRASPLAEADKAQLQKLCKAVFNQRRKMLRKSLQQLTPNAEALLEQAGIAPERRPESLGIEEFCRLARVLE